MSAGCKSGMFKNRTLVSLASSDHTRSGNLATPIIAMTDASGRARWLEMLGVAEVVGEASLTLERAYEFPGKLADARKLRQRLVIRSAGIEQRILSCRQQIKLARDTGHDFLEHKMKSDLRALEEDRLDTAALIDEVRRVFSRLKRERRALLYRIDCGEALVTALPAASRRECVRALFDEARRMVSVADVDVGTGVDV